jgi:hypothetical protein
MIILPLVLLPSHFTTDIHLFWFADFRERSGHWWNMEGKHNGILKPEPAG